MTQNDKKSLKHLAEQFKISTGLDTSKHVALLEKLKEYPTKDEVEILNYFASIETNPHVLRYLVKRISDHKHLPSIDILSDLLILKNGNAKFNNDTDKYIKLRCLIAKCLSSFSDNRAVLPLLYILNSKDENYKLRLCCAEALGQLGNHYAVSPLIDIVSDKTEQSIYLKESAAKALGMLGDIRAVEPLVAILESNESFINKFSFLKERILQSLMKIGFKDDRTFNAIKASLLDTSAYVRIEAIEALSQIEDDRVIPLIEGMLNDDDPEVAKNAVVALYNILGKEYLISMQQKEDIPLHCVDEATFILSEYEGGEDEQTA